MVLTVSSVALVLIGAAAVIYAVTDKSPSHAAAPPAAASASAPKVTVPAATTTTAAPASTTTVPPFHLVSNSDGTATYQVAAAAPISLSASGPCWVDAHKASSSGASVFTATMAAGQTQTLTAPVWIRLGAPAAVTIKVNGQALAPPATGGDPLDIELQ
jgi:hypothetical protein